MSVSHWALCDVNLLSHEILELGSVVSKIDMIPILRKFTHNMHKISVSERKR